MMRYFFASFLLLSACDKQLSEAQSLANAYHDGYAWAELHASAQSWPDCAPHQATTLQEKMIAKGCLAYLKDHPTFKPNVQSPPHTEGEVRVSNWEQPVIRPAPGAEDFDRGYEWATDEHITGIEPCYAIQESELYVKGCVQFVIDEQTEMTANEADYFVEEE